MTGADAVLEIFQWKEPQELFDLAHFIAATRPGFDIAEFEAHARDAPSRHHRDEHPGARDLVDRHPGAGRIEGRPIRYLVPEGVNSYVQKAGLYR